LQLVLHNLIRNGIEALEEAEVRGREVVVRVRRIDLAYIEVSVDDNGVGIDLGAEERVFLTSFTTKATGMGLGLSICRTLVEAHGGWDHPDGERTRLFWRVLHVHSPGRR
jgi:signal transduction histidine kinase